MSASNPSIMLDYPTNVVNGTDPVTSFEAKLEEFRRSDNERDELVKDLLDKYKTLQSQYARLNGDYENEAESRRRWQLEAQSSKLELSKLRLETESSSFVLALIDGDGAIFQDQLLRSVIHGGSEAGHLLHNEIKRHIQERHEGSGHWAIMVQIYANFDGLARKLVSLGILRTTGEFDAFAKSFNLSQPLFNLVDVGSGKERADHKLKEMFRVFVGNAQCKHIIFGGCHDNGYLPNIGQYQYDKATVARMTLLETTQPERGFLALGIPFVSFPSVFKDVPLGGPGINMQLPASTPAQMQLPYHTASPVREFVPSMPIAAPPAFANPLGSVNGPPPTPQVAAPPATIQPPKQSSAPAPPATNWAKISKTITDSDGFTGVTTVKARPTLPDPKLILLNKSDQRVDAKLPKVDSNTKTALEQRIKQQKVCNNFHLLNSCPSGSRCTFQHGERMGMKEQLALRLKARERACPRGSGCRQFDCLCGHVCPWPDCNWSSCFFGDLHAIDETVAMAMHEDGRIDIVR